MSLDPEIQALQKAVRARIDTLSSVTSEKRTGGLEIFFRDQIPFLQIEVRRDHLSLDLWLPDPILEDARSSGIARSHPFLGLDALKIRFERAADLARVARWIEESYAYSPDREGHRKELEARAAEEQEKQRLERPSEPPSALPKPLAIDLEDKPKRPPPRRLPGRAAPRDDEDEDDEIDLARRSRAEHAARAAVTKRPAKAAAKKAAPVKKAAAKKAPAKKADVKKAAKKPAANGKATSAKRPAGGARPKAKAVPQAKQRTSGSRRSR